MQLAGDGPFQVETTHVVLNSLPEPLDFKLLERTLLVANKYKRTRSDQSTQASLWIRFKEVLAAFVAGRPKLLVIVG